MAETIYTQLNSLGVPIRHLVITKKMIDTGLWGDPKTWVKGRLPIVDVNVDPLVQRVTDPLSTDNKVVS